MPQLKIPAADSALRPMVDQFIVTTHDCTIIVSRAYSFSRNRGLAYAPIVAINARNSVAGINESYEERRFIRQRPDVLAAVPSFTEAVAAAYGCFEAGPDDEEEVPAAPVEK